MADPANVAALLADLESEQARLRDILAGRPAESLDAHPYAGKWSVAENVRHLLFAEQLHLGRFGAGAARFSPDGVPPDGMRHQRRLQHLSPTARLVPIDGVLAEWAAFHAELRPRLAGDSDKLEHELQRNLRHLRTHIAVIERTLRKLDGRR